MANSTWNFPTWQWADDGLTGTRGDDGALWELKPQYLANTFTIIFPFLFNSAFTDQTNTNMTPISIGVAGTAYMAILLNNDAGSAARIWLELNNSAGTNMHRVYLGDEDGTNWLSEDKWYQLALSGDSSGISYVINGDSSPTETIVTNSPGTFSWNAAADRMWVGGNAAHNAANATNLNSSWCSHVQGPTAIHNTKLDLTDTAVLARIFDSNGDLKNPGADGSLWFSDVYGATPPSLFFHDGSPRLDYGDPAPAWTELTGDGNSQGMPGGLRKEYE